MALVLKGTSTETMMDLELVHRVAIDPPHILTTRSLCSVICSPFVVCNSISKAH